MNNIKKTGFTLAEVLITLGIIGVVAAMTIPTLIANTNSAKFRSQFKKTISTLNQAGLMAEAQYDFNYAAADAACTNNTDSAVNNTRTFCALLNGTLTGQTMSETSPYSEEPTIGSLNGYLSKKMYVTLADGSLVVFNSAAKEAAEAAGDNAAQEKGCTLAIGNVMSEDWIKAHKNCVGYIDVNGKTLPNKEVNCAKSGEDDKEIADGSAKLDPSSVCTVPSDSTHMTDIFPVVFHDATVEPATNAAKAVLATAK